MPKVIAYPSVSLGWERPPGPLRVWRIVEGRKKSPDGKTLRFSIQEVPKDRYDDVLEEMCVHFARDEPICRHSNVIKNPTAIEDFIKLWSFALQQGIVVGAFVVETNNPRPRLAAVNMTLVSCEAVDEAFKTFVEFKDDIPKKMIKFMHGLEEEKSPREFYKVDKYITAFGLSVDPDFRGEGLGFNLLDARTEMAAAYDIKATSTVFTAPAAQKVAAQSGFELLVERNFTDIRNSDGTEMFPGIPLKSAKLMGKSFAK